MHDISIIGAGISGLSSAIALKNFPLQIKIFEKNKTFSTLGAGIQLGPNGTRVLSSLGLLDSIIKKSSQPRRLNVFDIQKNKYLCGMKLGSNTVNKYGFPYLTILRSDLHSTLQKNLDKCKNVEVIRGFEMDGLEVLKDRISVIDKKGKNFNSRALIGSDGIHSIVRKLQFKNDSVGANQSTAYRTLIKNDCKSISKHSKDIKIWFGNAFHAITYPVGINNDINVVVVTKQIHHNDFGWSNPCHLNEFFSFFSPYPNSEITKLISVTSEWYKWPIFGCRPIKRTNEMTRGSIILLGDAAHYMKPHLAQGASMALEDSYQLLNFLKCSKFNKQIKWNNIFFDISKKRIRRIHAVQKKSIYNGYIFQWSGILRLLRNFLLRVFGESILDQKWLFKQLH